MTHRIQKKENASCRERSPRRLVCTPTCDTAPAPAATAAWETPTAASLDAFVEKYKLDDSAVRVLRGAPVHIQAAILGAEEMMENARNPSACIMSRIAAMRKHNVNGGDASSNMSMFSSPTTSSSARDFGNAGQCKTIRIGQQRQTMVNESSKKMDTVELLAFHTRCQQWLTSYRVDPPVHTSFFSVRL